MSKDSSSSSMPQSIAGLQRFSQEDTGKIRIKPVYVIVILVIVVLMVLFLHWQGAALLGA